MSLETGFKTNLLYTLKELHYYAKERNDVGKKMQGFLQLDKVTFLFLTPLAFKVACNVNHKGQTYQCACFMC